MAAVYFIFCICQEKGSKDMLFACFLTITYSSLFTNIDINYTF